MVYFKLIKMEIFAGNSNENKDGADFNKQTSS